MEAIDWSVDGGYETGEEQALGYLAEARKFREESASLHNSSDAADKERAAWLSRRADRETECAAGALNNAIGIPNVIGKKMRN